MTVIPPRPVHPNPSLHRDVCGTPSKQCHGGVHWFPTGRRCDWHSPAATRKRAGRHLTVVKP